MENKQSFGFNEDSHDIRDVTFGGANVPSKILREDGQWTPPQFEKQSYGSFDTQGCISFGTNNVLEMLHHVQFGYEPNYSDRFLVVNSGTTRGGNTPRKVYSALRKQGTVLEEDYPFPDYTKEDYYKEVPSNLLTQGKKWASTHSFSYAKVGTNPNNLKHALQFSPLGLGLYAWAKNSEGLYYQPNGVRANHFCVLIGYEEGKHWLVFDTYEESVKKLVYDYPFNYVCGYTLTKKKPYPSLSQNIWKDLFSYFKFKRA
ncbi:MAG TPA: hypothetical protein ENI23_08865 [bacterium]|nr:hypothetical protein [bacterium]